MGRVQLIDQGQNGLGMELDVGERVPVGMTHEESACKPFPSCSLSVA